MGQARNQMQDNAGNLLPSQRAKWKICLQHSKYLSRRRFAADAARLLASTLKADLAAREPRKLDSSLRCVLPFHVGYVWYVGVLIEKHVHLILVYKRFCWWKSSCRALCNKTFLQLGSTRRTTAGWDFAGEVSPDVTLASRMLHLYILWRQLRLGHAACIKNMR